jgi:hypothetical protein
MGFCTDEEHREFLRDSPIFEGFLVSQGIILLKYWLEVSEKEQHKRFLARAARVSMRCDPGFAVRPRLLRPRLLLRDPCDRLPH